MRFQKTIPQVLDNAHLKAIAPSIFADHAYSGMSDRYTFVPTIQVVEKMRQEGFVPVAATESQARIESKEGYTKHQIRFRDVRDGDAPKLVNLGELFMELVLTNAHDGGSSFRLDAGLWRKVCGNGLIVDAGNVEKVSFRHSGRVDDIIDASYEMVEEMPKVIDDVQQFSQRRLTAPQQAAFAEAAMIVRYGEDEIQDAPIRPEQLIQPRRWQDRDPSLWNTFNVVQENVLSGGLPGRNAETRRRVRTRPVQSIQENTRLNKALWALTERMNSLLTPA